ncbi:M48 family metalloprotease [Deinococcus navajonensis]|uniref:M48 family metalloprotease n=1 Tax=Deinococcus navajonensis TaxID=309884 RepID=A0ABV8XNR4_9DEIO
MSNSPAGRFAGLQQRVAQREAGRLRDAFISSPAPGRDGRILLARLVALLVLVGAAAVTLLGGWLLLLALGLAGPISSFTRVLAGVAALTILGFVWLARPRFSMVDGQVVTEAQAPTLHALVAEVASLMGVRQPAQLRVSHHLNAFMGHSGFPPRPALGLGLPLWFVLAPQERLSVLAHELAHQKNGDPARSHLIALALNFLGMAVHTLWPDWVMEARAAQQGLVALLINLILKGLALLPLGLYTLLQSLIGAEHQRAEFRADLLGAQVAGQEATLSALDAIHILSEGHLLETALQRQRSNPRHAHAFAELRQLWAEFSPAQRERVRAASPEDARLDASHPPTAHRLAVLQAHAAPARLHLLADQAARIDAELAPFVRRADQHALDEYRLRYNA